MHTDRPRKELSIRYKDDGNIEYSVNIEEVRFCSAALHAAGREGIRGDNNNNLYIHKGVTKKDTLPKPLVGLLEDDSDIRGAHRPTVVLHDRDGGTGLDIDSERAIIINGTDKSLAAGGGLRALRYLKK